MDAAVFSFIKNHPDSVIPSIKLARFLSEELEVPLFDDEGIDVGARVLFIVNGAYAFSKPPVLTSLGSAIQAAERVIWVQQDYTIVPPRSEGEANSPFRRAFVVRTETGKSPPDYWTTCDRPAGGRESRWIGDLTCYVNWNAFAWDPLSDDVIAKRRASANDRLLYYGAYRHDTGLKTRKLYFERYFFSPQVLVTISSTGKKFAEEISVHGVEHLPKFEGRIVDEISRYGAGLYLEDRMSHKEFHSPANRFYEMLSAGLPIIFQPECGEMLRKAGIDPQEFAARTPVEVRRIFEKREEIWRKQRELWGGRDHRGEMMEQFARAREKLEGALK